LQEVWNGLFAESALRDSEFAKVCSAYRESSRFHHNIEHIFDMLLLLDECIGENADLKLPLKEMKAAIFFHDFVYDSSKGDNEQQSSAAAREVLHNLGWGEDEIARVCAYIDATISHKVTANLPGCDIFLDLDLSILGTGRERYSRYAQDIRREYSLYSDQDFYRGRADFLEKFLERRRLFASDWGYERFERLARDNINAELRQLRAAAT
jgi:predicted metal-dependent HD superfamily phosphohydrolase